MSRTRPTLYLMVGLPGTGKTTLARRLEAERQALRLTKDEWVKALYGDDNPTEASDVIEGRLVDLGLRALELGVDVVIDFGLWASGRPRTRTRAGRCRRMSWLAGPGSSSRRRPGRSTGASRWALRRQDSPAGTTGARSAGRPGSYG